MDKNVFTPGAVAFTALVVLLWFLHACTFLPLAAPFFLQVTRVGPASLTIFTTYHTPGSPSLARIDLCARAASINDGTRQALVIGFMYPSVTSFLIVGELEDLSQRINTSLSKRFDIENLDRQLTKLDRRLKLKAFAVSNFAMVVYVACFCKFYAVRVGVCGVYVSMLFSIRTYAFLTNALPRPSRYCLRNARPRACGSI